jgi:hypothetical protein
MNQHLKTALIALGVIAFVFRVPVMKEIVTGSRF